MKVSVSPDVLRWARETALTTVDEAARRIGKDAQVVKSWEAGSDQPTYAQLESLADAYGISVNVFLLDDRPTHEGPPPDFRSGPDTGRPLSGGAARALRRATYLRDLLTDLGNLRAIGLPQTPPGTTPQAIGASVRAYLGVDISTQLAWADERAALRGWQSACERVGILVAQYRLAPDDFRGCSLRGNSSQGPVVVLNEQDAPAGRIFTLFHELAHLVTGAAGAICNPMAWNPVAGGTHEERRMNAAAGHALVPPEHLSTLDEVRKIAGERDEAVVLGGLGRLASRYKVSRQALWYQLYESKVVPWQQFDALWPSLKAATRPRARETPFVGPPRWERARRSYSADVLRGLLSAEQSGRISTRSLVAAIDVPVEDLNRLESTVFR